MLGLSPETGMRMGPSQIQLVFPASAVSCQGKNRYSWREKVWVLEMLESWRGSVCRYAVPLKWTKTLAMTWKLFHICCGLLTDSPPSSFYRPPFPDGCLSSDWPWWSCTLSRPSSLLRAWISLLIQGFVFGKTGICLLTVRFSTQLFMQKRRVCVSRS